LLAGTASAQAATAPTPDASAAPIPAAAGPAAAPSLADSLVDGAKEDYLAARLLYGSGDYAGARAQFEAA
jgi:hypothetical protein